NEIVIVAGANGRVSPADVERSRGLIQGAAFLLLQLEVPFPAVEAAARAARAAGVTVILDPAPARPEALGLLALADYVTPNESELLTLCGERPQAMGPDEAAGLARRLLARGARRVVAKLGPLGALLVSEERTSRWPGVAVQAVDTTGVGGGWPGRGDGGPRRGGVGAVGGPAPHRTGRPPGQDPGGLGRPDDRGQLRRPHRVQVQRPDHRGRDRVVPREGRERDPPGRPP